MSTGAGFGTLPRNKTSLTIGLLMGWSGRAPASPAIETAEGRQRTGSAPCPRDSTPKSPRLCASSAASVSCYSKGFPSNASRTSQANSKAVRFN
jgi:hypothetical protein